jgi:hypothetical protein
VTTEADEELLAWWLADNVCPLEASRDRLSVAVLERCRINSIEPPTSGPGGSGGGLGVSPVRGGLLAQPRLGDDGEIQRGNPLPFLDAEARALGPPDQPFPLFGRLIEVCQGLRQGREHRWDQAVVRRQSSPVSGRPVPDR